MLTVRSLAGLLLSLAVAFAAPPLSGNNGQSPLEEARRAFETNHYQQAAQILQAATASDPQNPELFLLLAKTEIQLEHFDAATQAAERAVALGPQNSVYHHWLGKAYGEKADRASWFSALSLAKKLRKEFETAVQLDERNFAARQDLIEYLCSAPGIVGGGEDKAQAHISTLMTMDAVEGHFAKGNCRRLKKDFPAADAEFDLALALGGSNPDLIYEIGRYALQRSQSARLLAVADAGEKKNPTDPRGDFYRAAAYILRGEKPAEAKKLLRAYITRASMRPGYPRPAIAHEWLARLFEQQGRTDDAAQEYRAALQLDPKSKPARDALKRLGKPAAP